MLTTGITKPRILARWRKASYTAEVRFTGTLHRTRRTENNPRRTMRDSAMGLLRFTIAIRVVLVRKVGSLGPAELPDNTAQRSI